MQPEGVPAPHIGSLPSDGFPQSAHETGIKKTVDTHSGRHKFSQNHTGGIPKHDEHDFFGPFAASHLARPDLIAGKPGCGGLLGCRVVNWEE